MARRFPIILILVLAATGAVGCERVWNASNRIRAAIDVKQLFEDHGLAAAEPRCEMVGTTRDFTCMLDATPGQVTTLVEGLSLRRIEASDSPDDPLAALVSRRSERCGAEFGDRPGMALFGIAGRPASLKLPGGSAFEFLLLYHDPASSAVCLAASYAYG